MNKIFYHSWRYRPFQVVLTALGLMLFCSTISCRKRGDNSVASGLILSGFAATSNGTPLSNADVILEGGQTPLAKTDNNGKFSILVPESYFSALSQTNHPHRTSWAIYVRKQSDQPLGGRSQNLDFFQRGVLEIGTINATPLNKFSGKVLKTSGSVLSPATQAKITYGPDQVLTSEDGTFEFPNAITGKSNIIAELDGFEPSVEATSLPLGLEFKSENPIVLFNSKEANAVLIPKSTIARDTDNSTNSFKTSKSFFVKTTPATKFIRYSHQLSELQKPISAPHTINTTSLSDQSNAAISESQSKWRPITSELDYSFPSSGSTSLWYQISDQTGQFQSDFKQTIVQINPCESFEGMTINDGNPISVSKLVRLNFKGLPSNATRVRISEDQSDLMMSPWLASKSSLDYVLSTSSRSLGGGSGGMGGGGSEAAPSASRQIFAEVDTSTGTCPVISATVQYRPFPNTGSMFYVNDGSGLSPSKIVMVTIPQLPPNAVEMRLYDLTPSGNTNPSSASRSALWVRAQNQLPFFFSDIGSRILGLEFRDIDGAMSPTYMTTVKITQENMVGFNIAFANYGTPPLPLFPPPSRYLVLQLLPPLAASTFRYLEVVNDGGNSNFGNSSTSSSCQTQDSAAITSRPWLNLVPFLPIYSCGVGLRQFIVQYQAWDGMITTVTNSIFIPSSPEILGNFVINNGDPLTLFPTVNLTVYPPTSAKAMSATNLSMQQTTANTSQTYSFGSSMTTSTNDQWLNPASSLDFRLDGRGVQTIQMRFRDENGNIIVPSIMKSIFYDPFPHFPEGIIPLKINGGAGITNSPLVTLSIKAPESAYSFRIANEINFPGVSEWTDIPITIKSNVPGAPWKMFEFTTPYIISGTAGPKIIYVQFKNELGDKSEVHNALINYEP